MRRTTFAPLTAARSAPATGSTGFPPPLTVYPSIIPATNGWPVAARNFSKPPRRLRNPPRKPPDEPQPLHADNVLE